MGKSWTNADLAAAMRCAAESCSNPKYLRVRGNRLLLNGFWRNGDKQNVCIWLDSATWHDAKTGEGGGCKEFAQMAFGSSLPEFMSRFGQTIEAFNFPVKTTISAPKEVFTFCVDSLWHSLLKNDQDRLSDPSREWLQARGFKSPRQTLDQSFVNLTKKDLDLFEVEHRNFLSLRLSLGPQLIAAIRGVNSDKVKNLFFRAISDTSKQDKSRLLTGAGGWSDEDGSPRAFGFPNLIHDFPNLLICEGLADYFAAEYLLHNEEKFLPIGAPNAAFLPKWAEWLVKSNYRGRVIWIYQLDVDNKGLIKSTQPGQLNATKASKILRTAGISSELFKWYPFLKQIQGLREIPNDLADVYDIARDEQHRFNEAFFAIHKRERDAQ